MLEVAKQIGQVVAAGEPAALIAVIAIAAFVLVGYALAVLHTAIKGSK